jgi:23S rRNA (adenine2030-N6)-methyltransferase
VYRKAVMNYRHAFHAGSFADVLKHATLVRILLHLLKKTAPFRVLDTHAGAGRYDLTGTEASRGGEWRDGIARLLSASLPMDAGSLLAPYLDAVAHYNGGGRLTVYPGSPLLVRTFLRPQDRLIACELQPEAAAALASNLAHDARCKAIAIDGWTALNAFIPPKERRGLVVIDPPFEEVSEFARVGEALEAACRKWASGTYLVWYPLKERGGADRLGKRLRQAMQANILRAELSIGERLDAARLHACGVMVINPPWTLENELRAVVPALVQALSQGKGGGQRLDWLRAER